MPSRNASNLGKEDYLWIRSVCIVALCSFFAQKADLQQCNIPKWTNPNPEPASEVFQKKSLGLCDSKIEGDWTLLSSSGTDLNEQAKKHEQEFHGDQKVRRKEQLEINRRMAKNEQLAEKNRAERMKWLASGSAGSTGSARGWAGWLRSIWK